jgi:aspartyl-tRNA(Asn)/glutamyl-tRNA(Gln) amidotransferase subunit C
MKIDDAMIDRIAALACLRFNDEEKEEISPDLGKILGFVSKLKELDTEGVEPLIYLADSRDCLREDLVKPSLCRKDVLRNAPDADNNYFLVPQIIDIKKMPGDE